MFAFNKKGIPTSTIDSPVDRSPNAAHDDLVGFNYTYLFALLLVLAGAATFYGFADTWGISVGAQQTMGPLFGLVVGKLIDNITSVTGAITRLAGVEPVKPNGPPIESKSTNE